MSDASTDTATLIPGHRWVDQFGDDDEYERDESGNVIEDVEYVTVDLGVVEPTLVPSSSAYRLLGLDTPNPYLQLSGTIFKGKHQTTLGTELLFTDAPDDCQGRTKRGLVHVANTEKRIAFREVELREKGAGPPGGSTAAASKKHRPRTVEQVVGNDPAADEQPVRRRGGRKAKGKARDDGAEPGADTPRPHDDPMDTSES
ncbi:TFIIIC subunit 6 domain-containing protein [Phanerochaete sordida]|uniref:TFIIIC subunit 6 domain-containing protein n=1 Tax=Phanerochaete sordida TaxID=48140 RepID=A0A9P3LFI3_9APHY|nr:TFIIIC subunit 6 domain-containing protein [Phanerochaete sordida]